MSIPLVKKLPRPGSCAPAVLITKEDLDALRAHALSPSRELPRCLPSSAPAARPAPGRTASPTRDVSAQQWPTAQRRTRSASSRRRPAGPPPGSGLPAAQNVGDLAEFSGGLKPTRIVRSQQLSSLNRLDKKVVEPKVQASARGQISTSAPARSAAAPPVSGALQIGPTAAKLELCGFGSKPQRSEVSMPDRDPAQLRLVGASPSPCLQISGSAAVVSHHPAVTSDTPAQVCSKLPDWIDEEWVTSEEENADGNEALVDSDGDVFSYRKYRYSETARSKPPEPTRKRLGARRSAQPRGSACEAGVESDDDLAQWTGLDEDVHLHCLTNASAGSVPSYSPCSTPCCELDEDRLEDGNLKRVAEVLIQFYGLPDDLTRAIRFRHDVSNVVIVEESAWIKRQRESALDEPPMMWVRGGRVYDFHGDRGTLAEFEHDLLVRQVEDDSICRLRRREQGLMPYPFLALPLKEKNEDAT